MHSGPVRIGCAAGFAGDRLDASEAIINHFEKLSGPRYLMYEILAERTLAITKTLHRLDPTKGYSPFLEIYLSPVLARCHKAGIKIVTNAGASNPTSAAQWIIDIATRQGLKGYRVAVVTGDDLFEQMNHDEISALERFDDTDIGNPILSANVYMGASGVVKALSLEPDIVITGRVADPVLALGPLIHEYGWKQDSWDQLAAGTLVGHLIECGGQVSGATFVDPGRKDAVTLNAPGLSAKGIAHMGYPIAEVAADGSAIITKPPNTGGFVGVETVKEQLLYEIHDPSAYITPDVVLDVTQINIALVETDRVRISGARGSPAPEKLKVTTSYNGGWLGEASLSYAGANSLARARFALEVLRERLKIKTTLPAVRLEIIGLASILDNDSGDIGVGAEGPKDGDYRIRAAIRTLNKDEAEWVIAEVLALWAAGPAGAAGFRESLTPQTYTGSVLVDRHLVAEPTVSIVET